MIPAIFYPELKYVDVTAPDGSKQKVAQGIPWQLYLYHTGFHGHERLASAGGEWVLEDLMAADKRPKNRVPSKGIDAAMLQQGAMVDPPWELFEQLNSSLRFPMGRLEVALPSGKRRSLATTEPTTLSGFLTKLGIALAAIGLVLLTGGAGTPGSTRLHRRRRRRRRLDPRRDAGEGGAGPADRAGHQPGRGVHRRRHPVRIQRRARPHRRGLGARRPGRTDGRR